VIKERLVVFEQAHNWAIGWDFGEGCDAFLGQDPKDGTGKAPVDKDSWEHWAASKALRDAGLGFKFDSRTEALKALSLARAALKTKRPFADWELKALAAGWTPPKGR